MSDDNNIVNFMEKFNQKQAEEFKEESRQSMKLYLAIVLFKIELITREPFDGDYREEVTAKVCKCLDVANDEFINDNDIMDKYGEDESTPSIQLLLINKVINRTIELYFDEQFQADKVDKTVSIWDKEKNEKVNSNNEKLNIGADGLIYEMGVICLGGDVWALDREHTPSSKYEIKIEN